jgi:hypothetical protein
MTSSVPPWPPAPAAPLVPGPVLIPPESVPDRQGVMSIMSKVTRHGPLILPRLFRALAFMGEVVVDLTQVRLGPGTSEIQVRAVMGQVTIIVPHNLRVECDGHAIMGEFSVKQAAKTIPSPDAPLIRVTGTSFMAAVHVKIRDPNAPGWLDRLRKWQSGQG